MAKLGDTFMRSYSFHSFANLKHGGEIPRYVERSGVNGDFAKLQWSERGEDGYNVSTSIGPSLDGLSMSEIWDQRDSLCVGEFADGSTMLYAPGDGGGTVMGEAW